MGFFKKLGKKLRGAFKKIGRGIKKGFQKFGKFMNKIGIMGQIAMFFILPAVGGAMLRGIGSMAGLQGAALGTSAGFTSAVSAAKAAGTLSGFGGALANGVAWTLNAASKFAASPIVRPFKTVTDAVSGFIDNTTRFVGNKVGLSGIKPGSDFSNYFAQAPETFFKSTAGGKSVLGEVGKGIVDNINQFTYDIGEGRLFSTQSRPVPRPDVDLGMPFPEQPMNVPNAYQGPNVQDTNQFRSIQTSAGADTVAPSLLEEYQLSSTPYQGSVKINTPSGQALYGPENVLETMNQTLGTDLMEQGFSYDKSMMSMLGEGTKSLLSKTAGSVGESLKPSSLATSYVQQSVVAPLMAPDMRTETPFGSVSGPVQRPSQDYSLAYASLMSQAPATSQMFGSEYDYFTASQAELYGSPQGQWGGINAYNDYMARFA